MKDAITKAIEGGYEPFKTVKMSELVCELHGYHYTCNFKDPRVKGICGTDIHKILLDPLFWQSLGKSLKWVGWFQEECQECGNEVGKGRLSWQEQWHRFIDHLASGKEAEDFFNQLLR